MERINNIETIPEEGPPGSLENPATNTGNLIDVDGDTTTSINTTTKTTTPMIGTISLEPTLSASLAAQLNLEAPKQSEDKSKDDPSTKQNITTCEMCNSLRAELDALKAEKLDRERTILTLKTKLESNTNELEREVQRRVDLEQQFTEEAKRTTDQIEELIAKSDRDDAKLNELKRKFELYSRETSSMIESFTTNREILTSQLLELRKENDYLLGKYIGKARDLQSEEINLPQNVEELQFHCLTLNEKLILATLAKERLEETLIRDSDRATGNIGSAGGGTGDGNSGSGGLIDHTTPATTTS